MPGALEKCAQPAWLCAYAGKARYGRYNSQVCGKHTESAKAGRFRASAMGVMRDLPAVNANETVYRNALILAILLAANSFYHTSAPIARIKVPLFYRSHLYSIQKFFCFQHQRFCGAHQGKLPLEKSPAFMYNKRN